MEFQKKTGVARVISAFGNSFRALMWLLKNEAAFAQECLIALALTALSLTLPFSAELRFALFGAMLFVLIVEVLNTAVEKAIDRISLELHPLSGLAKDLGSLAVMLSFLPAIALWVYALFYVL